MAAKQHKEPEKYNISWKQHAPSMASHMQRFLGSSKMSDVTLASGTERVKCHRVVLASCSPYFEDLFSDLPENVHAFVILKDAQPWEIKAVIDFMYKGDIQVPSDRMSQLLKFAASLQIRGLCQSDNPEEEEMIEQVEDADDNENERVTKMTEETITPTRPTRTLTKGQQKKIMYLRSQDSLILKRSDEERLKEAANWKLPKMSGENDVSKSRENVASGSKGPSGGGRHKRSGGEETKNTKMVAISAARTVNVAPLLKKVLAKKECGDEEDEEYIEVDYDDTKNESDGVYEDYSFEDSSEHARKENPQPESESETTEPDYDSLTKWNTFIFHEAGEVTQVLGKDAEKLDVAGFEEDLEESSRATSESGRRKGKAGRSHTTVGGRRVYKYDKWERDDALNALGRGMSLRQCSEVFNIPRKTLAKWRGCVDSCSADDADAQDVPAGPSGDQKGLNIFLTEPPILYPPRDGNDRAERLKKAASLAIAGITVRQAAVHYSLPRTTLCAYMKRQGLNGPKRSTNSTISSVAISNMSNGNSNVPVGVNKRQQASQDSSEGFPFLGLSELVNRTEMHGWSEEQDEYEEVEYSEEDEQVNEQDVRKSSK